MPTVSSDTEICNLALLDLGHEKISAIGEATRAGLLCDAYYVPTRDAALRSHLWNFATKRVALAAVTYTDPLAEYDNAFQLPTDYLRMIRTDIEAAGYDDGDWRIEWGTNGSVLVTNEATVAIEYIARITDVSRFDPLFVAVLSKMLAIAMCMKLADNAALKQLLVGELRELMAGARTTDAMEGTPRAVNGDQWVISRV